MRHKLPGLLPLVLLVLTLAVFAPSFSHTFIENWDDDGYVTENEAVRGITPGHLHAAFSSAYVGNYAPVQIISYMVDYSFWGLKPAGFILTNILCHALNGILLYYLVVRLHGRRIWAFCAALLFLLHPVQVESVVWVSQRKTVLALFFFLGAIHLYLRYRHKAATGRWWYAASVASFIMALLTKSVTVILPVVLICYELITPPAPGRKRQFADKIPYVVAAMAVGILTFITQDRGQGGGRTPYPGGSPLATFYTMLPVFATYLGKLFWPAELSVIYSPPVRTTPDGAVLLAAGLLLLVAAAGFVLRRRNPGLFFWFAVFVVGFVPIAQIVPIITLMNDRYLYFPMVGMAPLLTALPVWLLERPTLRWRVPGGLILVLLVSTLAVMTVKREAVWQNEETLWEDTVRKVPDSITARNNLTELLLDKGNRYEDAGDHDGALRCYQRILAIDPADQLALNNIGALYTQKGDFHRALGYFLRLTESYPWYDMGLTNLGFAYQGLGETGKALAAYERALVINPASASTLRKLGDLQARLGRTAEASASYRRAEAVSWQ